jgi:hypothetical protein
VAFDGIFAYLNWANKHFLHLQEGTTPAAIIFQDEQVRFSTNNSQFEAQSTTVHAIVKLISRSERWAGTMNLQVLTVDPRASPV